MTHPMQKAGILFAGLLLAVLATPAAANTLSQNGGVNYQNGPVDYQNGAVNYQGNAAQSNQMGDMAYGVDGEIITPLQPVQAGNVTYVTGGIGEGERAALQAEAKNYNLKIVNSDRSGAFMAGTQFVVQRKDGREMIQINDAGPILYANLPPGKYVIQASNGQEQRDQTITVSGKQSKNIHLVW